MSTEGIELSVVSRGIPLDPNLYVKAGFMQVVLSWQTKREDKDFHNELHVTAGDLRKNIKGLRWEWNTHLYTLHLWMTATPLAMHFGRYNRRTLRVIGRPEEGDWWRTVFQTINSGRTTWGNDLFYAAEHPAVNRTELNNVARAAASKAMPAGVLIDYLRELSPTVESWLSKPEDYVSN